MTQPSTLQSFPLEAGIQAIKDSVNFTDFEAFYSHLLESLPQNSPGTRKRYASLVVRWLFPERKLGGILPRAWQAYRDDQLLLELARVTVLEVEPVIARFVTEVIQSMPVGRDFDQAQARDFITSLYGAFKKDSYDRLLVSTRQLGFLERLNNKSWGVAAVLPPTDALLILLHARLGADTAHRAPVRFAGRTILALLGVAPAGRGTRDPPRCTCGRVAGALQHRGSA